MIRFEQVSMRYETGEEVLHDINLSLQPGAFHFLTGASGAGKTSLLRLIFLNRLPSQGKIYLFGQDVARLPRRKLPALRRKMGVVFQDFRLIRHLTTYENVALPLTICGDDERAYRRDVEELLEWVGLGDKLNVYPALLSGGEQQRIAIARAVVARPSLLIADEPTGNVDAEMARRLMGLFVELNRQGTSVLIATHDETLIRGFSFPTLRLTQGVLR
ncbi:MAG: cell division ATP-binding protein FtsE [Parvibaculales bacterium]